MVPMTSGRRSDSIRPCAGGRRGVATLVAAALLTACAPRPEPLPPPIVIPLPEVPPVSPWPGVLLRAKSLADAGRYSEADRVLAEFAVSRPGSAEGAEADFWRALFRADPANSEATVRDQLAALDTYLNGGPSMPRRAEAMVLRRLVEAADSARSVITAVRAAALARERAKGDEVKRLSDELEKTLAELDRIRRRLAPRPPDTKPPPDRTPPA